MHRTRLFVAPHPTHALLAAMVSGLCLTAAALAAPSRAATASPAAHPGQSCGPGARTLAPVGSRLYPDTGNGGYVSVHTDIHMVYDATSNTFLPGNHVVLTDLATQCLSSFSLDFERTSADKSAGPDMSVRGVLVDASPQASLSRSLLIRAIRMDRTTLTRPRTRRRSSTPLVVLTTTRSRPRARRS